MATFKLAPTSNHPVVSLLTGRFSGYRDSPKSVNRETINALTIDLEDWPVAVIGPDQPISTRVVENTKRLLQILHWHHVKATFFVLSRVAEKFPELIHEVHQAGHEIASHGHTHELLTTISPHRFEEDVRRSIDILTDITGEKPLGYRAPAFSVVDSTRWAGRILADLGFQYSSSIFPIRHPRYGISEAPRGFHRWPDCNLLECPPATVQVAGHTLPIGGGGYFRLMPGFLARQAVRRVNSEGMPAVLYLHPYEFDPDGISRHRSEGVPVGVTRQFTQGLFRDRMEGRLHRLLDQFRFRPLKNLIPDYSLS
jgi:polysaccharide deacetylase family protein (PEP-CTERM system associated)